MAQTQNAVAEKVEFSGSLVFANVAALRDKLAAGLASGSVEIAFGEVGEVDLSFLQLLCAALRTAAETSRKMTLSTGPVPESLRTLAETAGMLAADGRQGGTFWKELAERIPAHG